jgi:hypothetical protein
MPGTPEKLLRPSVLLRGPVLHATQLLVFSPLVVGQATENIQEKPVRRFSVDHGVRVPDFF